MIRELLISLLTASAAVLSTVSAAPLNVMVLGDDFSEETSAQVAGTTRLSWMHYLQTYRAPYVNFKEKATDPGTAYSTDLRKSGFGYNVSMISPTTIQFPRIDDTGATTGTATVTTSGTLSSWASIVNATPTFGDQAAIDKWHVTTRVYKEVHSKCSIIVVALGNKELRDSRNLIYGSNTNPSIFQQMRNQYGVILDDLFEGRQNTTIVLAQQLDPFAFFWNSATYATSSYTDPALRLIARNRIQAFNNELRVLAQEKQMTNLNNRVIIADFEEINQWLYDSTTLNINGIPFLNASGAANQLFITSNSNYNPNRVLQSLMAQKIFDAISQSPNYAGVVPLKVENREILQSWLAFDPDLPYNNWLTAMSPSFTDKSDDEDMDSLPNLVEFALGNNPTGFESPIRMETGAKLTFTPDATALQYADLWVDESVDPTSGLWSRVPSSRISKDSISGKWTILPEGERKFYRLVANVKP